MKGTDFYSFEDDFVAKFPKIYNQKSEIQILYSSLTDFDEEPHLITLNQLLQLASTFFFSLKVIIKLI